MVSDKEAYLEDYWERKQIDQIKEEIVRIVSSPDVRERLHNIMIMDVELYYEIREMIVNLYRRGQLKERGLTTNKLKLIVSVVKNKRYYRQIKKWGRIVA